MGIGKTARRRAGLTLAATALLAAATTAATAPAGVTSARAAPERGHLVLIGGNLAEDAEILQRIVDLADPDGPGGRPARIAIVTAAAFPTRRPSQARPELNNSIANGLYYAELFEAYGAETYAVPIDEQRDYPRDPYVPRNAQRRRVVEAVQSATGVFFGGGDQMRYVRTLLDCRRAAQEAFTECTDTPVLAAIRGVLDRGGVIAGVSAGLTIQQGTDMITGGYSHEAWRDGATPGYLDDDAALGYVPYGGFGWFTDAMLDSHFTTWGRQARMIRLAQETGHDRVVGVDETTALVVDRAARTAEVIGHHSVAILDVGSAEFDGPAVTGVRWTSLVAGDRLDLATWTVTPGTAVTTGPGTGPPPATASDVWDSVDGPNTYTLRDLARALVASSADSADGVTLETDPQYRTTVSRSAATSWWAGGAGFQDLDLAIDLAP